MCGRLWALDCACSCLFPYLLLSMCYIYIIPRSRVRAREQNVSRRIFDEGGRRARAVAMSVAVSWMVMRGAGVRG